eukprot:COSAG06_NODE_10601_length_1650_cov_2.894262_2_plen_78_part_00
MKRDHLPRQARDKKRKKRKLETEEASVRPQASIVPVKHFGFGGGMTDGLQDIIQEVGDDLLEAVETVRKKHTFSDHF